MPYTISIARHCARPSAALRTAQRGIGSLQQDMRRRIEAAIDALATTPRPPTGRPPAGQQDVRRPWVGGYRIIYEIDDSAATVVVTRVAHRREAYRGL